MIDPATSSACFPNPPRRQVMVTLVPCSPQRTRRGVHESSALQLADRTLRLRRWSWPVAGVPWKTSWINCEEAVARAVAKPAPRQSSKRRSATDRRIDQRELRRRDVRRRLRPPPQELLARRQSSGPRAGLRRHLVLRMREPVAARTLLPLRRRRPCACAIREHACASQAQRPGLAPGHAALRRAARGAS